MPFNIRTDGCSPGEVAKLTGKMRKPAEARTQQQLQARLLPRIPARPSASKTISKDEGKAEKG